MTDSSPSWRELAEAGHTGDERTARSALDHADPVRRELALGALARMGALDDRSLIALFGDAHPAVRRRAATIAATRPQLDLLGLLADTDASVVEVAAWAAGEHERRDDPTVARLVELATGHSDALVREAAVAALGAIGDESTLPTVVAATNDKAAVRRRAAVALANFDGVAADDALRRLLDDRDWQTRQIAEEDRKSTRLNSSH